MIHTLISDLINPLFRDDILNNSNITNSKNQDEKGTESNLKKGILYSFLASLLYALMIATWKQGLMSNPKLTGFDYVLVRSILTPFLLIFQITMTKDL